MKSFVLALFLSHTSSIRIRTHFASGVGSQDSFEDVQINGRPFDYQHMLKAVASEERWVELPICPATLGANDVPLYDDRSNASVATCKGYVPHNSGNHTDPYSSQINTNPALYHYHDGTQPVSKEHDNRIFDPRQRTSLPLQNHEHQVTTHEEGHVDPTLGPLKTLAQSRWVELPDCEGKEGEVPLDFWKDNASSATC